MTVSGYERRTALGRNSPTNLNFTFLETFRQKYAVARKGVVRAWGTVVLHLHGVGLHCVWAVCDLDVSKEKRGELKIRSCGQVTKAKTNGRMNRVQEQQVLVGSDQK